MVRIFVKMINILARMLGYVGAGLVALLAILLMYDVFMRFVLNDPVDWVLDITQLLQAALALLAASYVYKVGGHVNMNLLTEFISNPWKRILAIAANSISLLGCAWMSFLTWSLFTKSLMIEEAMYSLDLPLYPWKFMVPLCFALMSLQSLANLLEAIQTPPELYHGQEEGGF